MENIKKDIKVYNKKNSKKEIEKEDDDEEEDKNEDDENKLGEKLINIRGLFGTKFKYDKIDEPWLFVTVKNTKIKKYLNSFEKEKNNKIYIKF